MLGHDHHHHLAIGGQASCLSFETDISLSLQLLGFAVVVLFYVVCLFK